MSFRPSRAAAAPALLLSCALLAACGGRQSLKRTEDMGPMPVARGASTPASPDALMEPGMQARPDRDSELLRRSQERAPDPFDLPPAR